MTRISIPCSSRWVAKLWRKVCGVTRLLIAAMSAAARQARVSWRVVIGLTAGRPGNSQPWGRAMQYHSRKSLSRTWDSIARAILAAFALLDAQHHALRVDVGYLQRH